VKTSQSSKFKRKPKANPKSKEKVVNCYKCTNFLTTNPLCKLNKQTPQTSCKYYMQGVVEFKFSNKPIEIVKPKKVKPVDLSICINCSFNKGGFCQKMSRWASHARRECT
jgi:hypothetical protein